MQTGKLGYFVLGASVAMLLSNLARRRYAEALPLPPSLPIKGGGHVIDLASWKAKHRPSADLEVLGS
jgi:hypothetical protein